MAELRDMLERLMSREDLSEAQASDLLVALTDASMAPAMAGALLAALRSKGVTADEVRGFARAMRRLARRPAISETKAIDIKDWEGVKVMPQPKPQMDLEGTTWVLVDEIEVSQEPEGEARFQWLLARRPE